MENYTPILVLIIGLGTLVGLWGAGTILLFFARLRLPSPWNLVTAILLGIQALSLAVQIAGIYEIASQSALSAMWGILVAVGAAKLTFQVRMRLAAPFLTCDRWALLPFAIIGSAVATDLLVAIAPTTKIDELYYHMLVPSRIVTDGALRFYREPWEGAILPDMLFQISSAPVHAVGYPDAANVVSWGISIVLLWFAWRVIRAHGKDTAWSALWVGSLCVGIYPAVWHVTGGAHAMGDLAMAAAVVAFCTREHLLLKLSPPAYAALLSVLLLSAAASKVSLLPLCVAITCLGTWPLLRSLRPPVRRHVILAIAAPWIIFYCPIALWSWAQSGSPFGPILAGAFGFPIYSDNWIREIQSTRDANQLSLSIAVQNAFPSYSPLVWLGVIGAIFCSTLPRMMRTTLCCLLVLQCTLIYWLLPYDARFLGGFHYGLVVAFAAFVGPQTEDRLGSIRSMVGCCAILLLPWLGVQIYYSKQFFPVSLGHQKTAFYERYVSFYKDYIVLNRLLSKDTVLLIPDFRLSAAYAPRPVFFDPADLPRGKQVVLFALPQLAADPSLGGYKRGKTIYVNSKAVTETYRAPDREPMTSLLEVFQLIEN